MTLNHINYGIEVLLATIFLMMAAFFVGGWREGKRSANRWYSEHPSVIYAAPTYMQAEHALSLDDWITINDAKVYVSQKGYWSIRCIVIDGPKGIIEPNYLVKGCRP